MLWYVDGNEKTLKDQCLAVPILFQHLQGYRQPEKHKHKKVDADCMKSGDLRNHSLALATLSATSYMKSQQWSSVREVLQDFSKNLNTYAQYLEERNEAMKSRQSHLELRTDLDDLSILGSKS